MFTHIGQSIDNRLFSIFKEIHLFSSHYAPVFKNNERNLRSSSSYPLQTISPISPWLNIIARSFFYISLPRDHIRKSHLECDLRFVINTLDATTPENAMDTSAIIPYFHINRVIVIVSPISLFSYSLLLKGNTYSHIPNVHPFPILG